MKMRKYRKTAVVCQTAKKKIKGSRDEGLGSVRKIVSKKAIPHMMTS
jgi:hypothetical protein